MTKKNLSAVLKEMKSTSKEQDKDGLEDEIKELQLQMLRIQQGVYHRKDRVVIVFEGFDAAGKGGTIRKITEVLDPRGFKVVPIAAPTPLEQGTHWLYRFWVNLPRPGTITIFDRSWYGRVLVEKVEKLTPAAKLKEAYREINEFEAQLQNDGINVIKIFLALSKSEQLKRFNDRLNDPYKQWKLTEDDIKARRKWSSYVKAVDVCMARNNTSSCPWEIVPADSKKVSKHRTLSIITTRLSFWAKWMEKAAFKYDKARMARALKNI